jgi:hypothetical protein
MNPEVEKKLRYFLTQYDPYITTSYRRYESITGNYDHLWDKKTLSFFGRK